MKLKLKGNTNVCMCTNLLRHTPQKQSADLLAMGEVGEDDQLDVMTLKLMTTDQQVNKIYLLPLHLLRMCIYFKQSTRLFSHCHPVFFFPLLTLKTPLIVRLDFVTIACVYTLAPVSDHQWNVDAIVAAARTAEAQVQVAAAVGKILTDTRTAYRAKLAHTTATSIAAANVVDTASYA